MSKGDRDVDDFIDEVAPFVAVVIAVLLAWAWIAPRWGEWRDTAQGWLDDRGVSVGTPVTVGKPYDRDEFGRPWADVDGNGCDTRNDVLARDLTGERLRGTCVVLSGRFTDPYTGKALVFDRARAGDVHVDHVVPLSWAWRHGADGWSDAEREAFSNDPANLLATAGPVNAAKGDSPPSEWLPPSKAAHCRFGRTWAEVTGRYGLQVPAVEARLVAALVKACPS